MNSKNHESVKVKNTTLDTEILPTINSHNIKTNIINTNYINSQSNEEYISLNAVKKCKLNEFTKEKRNILEDVIDRLYYADTLKVDNVVITNPKILLKTSLIKIT